MIKNKKILGLNINEILLDENLLSNDQTLNSFFFDCQCAIFIVDITSQDSLSLVKQLISRIIINLNCPYLKKLLIINKIDLEEKRKVPKIEIYEYISQLCTELEFLETSIKVKKNLEELWEKVYNYVNMTKIEIPINLLEEKIETIDDGIGEGNLVKEGSINIILIGDSGVGKTNLFQRYFQNKFEEMFISTIGIDRQTKIIKYKNKLYRVNVNDTAGQERFRSLPIKYYQNADGALLLYDISKIESFENVKTWMEDLKKNQRSSKQTIYLIGNKIDLSERMVTQEEAKEMAQSLGIKYYEMSCKINMNIYEIISRLIIDCLNNLIENGDNGFRINKKKSKSKNGCC